MQKLVSIPSPYFQERKIASFTKKWLEERGLEAKEQEFFDDKITKVKSLNIIGSLSGTGPGPRILLNGHYDTVELCNGWSIDPYEGYTKDGKMFGLGVLDMKAGVCALMLALEALEKDRDKICGEVFFSFVGGEEGPFGLGTGQILKDGLAKGFDLALVTEPSAGFSNKEFPCVCLGARGGVAYSLEVKGKSAHGANPEQGVNAVTEAASLIRELEKIGFENDPELGSGCHCITEFSGGGEPLSVPDRATIKVFRHMVRKESRQTVEAEVKAAIKKAQLKSSCQIKFRQAPYKEVEDFVPYVTDKDHPLVKSFIETCGKVANANVQYSCFSSVGDFNHLGGYAGIPTLILGPEGAGYHGADEWVDLESVRKTSETIYRFLFETLVERKGS